VPGGIPSAGTGSQHPSNDPEQSGDLGVYAFRDFRAETSVLRAIIRSHQGDFDNQGAFKDTCDPNAVDFASPYLFDVSGLSAQQ
jgi:hypothetical protein